MKRENTASLIENIYRNKSILLIGLTYFAWGFSYLIFSTFFVDYLMIDIKLEMNVAGKFFAIAGIISVVSGIIWGDYLIELEECSPYLSFISPKHWY